VDAEGDAKLLEINGAAAPLEQQARQAFDLRNSSRSAARDAMMDREEVARLDAEESNLTWEQVVQKYSSRYSGDDLWREIINASQRSRVSVNKLLGVTGPGVQ
jgi:filamentous hemagglutinin